ncbi:uncharacterized protein LOC110721000 [Chenopodium quinoa]|uniref:uncharacterized protein LOC110721000 n=1 Tax=Chenopodium quinoa TaxID=63459 RepID=UPI000B7701E8|nr:uncharacterized protein LOC110721000 [Chenopodium quinoa]XP_021755816.1 uncharacterized protein LOC110721000 [Chenopodium quinoa]XP_021755817.1 uncharacterized protein LOC110721000 [Chenopodium quinoa]XP_021755818.1 uncharacterized protein LOC110721000 [Chenopodium quinoa]
MDRSWMYGKRNTREFLDGVKEFCRCAKEHQKSSGDDEIYCPCRDCFTVKKFSDIKIIEEHLIRRGFRQAYHVWLWHGERLASRETSSVHDIQLEESDESDESERESCESDVGDEDNDDEEDHMDEMMDGVGDHLNERDNKRSRGPSKEVQVKEPMFLEYDDLGQPTGDWEHVYGRHLGCCAKKININVKRYRLVPEADKQKFWDKTKALFHIEDGPKKEKEKLFHSGVANRFRGFKAKLVSRWITKTRKPPEKSAHLMPWEIYKGFITKADWKKFEGDRTTDEAKAISDKARKNAIQNKYYHHLGSKSYKRSKAQWIKDGRYPTDTDGAPSCRIAKRGLEWILARQVPGEGGTWVITNDETRKVAKKYEDYTQKQAQGTFIPQRNVDALCMALGKKDHSGRVYGVGGLNVGYCKAFGKPDQKVSELNQSQQSLEEMKEAIKATLVEEFEQKLKDQVEMQVKQALASMRPQLPQVTSSNLPPPMLKALKTCRLAVWDAYSGNKVVVAGGTAYPYGDGPMYNQSIKPGHMKVCINDPYSDFVDVDLPVPTEEGVTKIGEARDNFVQWPAALVLFEDEEATPEKRCEGSSNEKLDSSDLQLQQVGEDMVASIGEKSKLLHLQLVMASQPERYDVTTVPLDAKVFHLEKDTETFITVEDITLLLRGARLSISIVQVFMMFLIDKYISSFDLSHIGFLCPQTIAASNVRHQNHQHQVTVDYIRDVFLSSRDRGDAGYQLILAPYYEEEHWMLIVINLTCGKVFKFNSSKAKKGRSLAIKGCLDMAYKVYKGQGRKGRKPKLKWSSIKCAQQTGDTESGCYVMKFMHEIVTLYGDCQNMDKEYQRRDEPYTDEEINEVREQWAIFFGDKYL